MNDIFALTMPFWKRFLWDVDQNGAIVFVDTVGRAAMATSLQVEGAVFYELTEDGGYHN